LRTAAEAAAPDKVLIAGVGKESVKSTVAMAEWAARLQFDAVLVRTPTYYSPQMSAEAVLTYYRSVADRSPLPVLLYNIPRFVPYNIPVEVIAELAQHSNIIGIKESSGSLERVRAIVEATRSAPRLTVTVTSIFEAATARMLKPGIREPEPSTFVSAEGLAGGVALASAPPKTPVKTRTKEIGFQVLTGSVSTIVESLESGATGAILGFAACAPQACQEVYLAWKDHDPKLAAAKQERIAEPSRQIVAGMGISGVKYACDFNGYYGGHARLPMLPINMEQRSEIERLLAGIRN
ncbi:MAG: dihydrodipicolinate synthase family protein, partial [Terracidiphilus sp.]